MRYRKELDYEEVQKTAYLNYCNRIEKGLPGDPLDDWLKAEEFVKKRSSRRKHRKKRKSN
ncbi:MAG: hypothetical protein ACE5QV_09770 [Fidelibacterota bacterium]